ncbi:MAG: zinc finger domain-containing protein [Flaviflexus sp.]|nr:zinc finger domain-containing protein [Flaviflexus sp.]
MPEGHSIHRLALALGELFGGSHPDASSPQGRFSQGAALLNGEYVGQPSAWGKHLFVPFGDEAEIGEDGPRWLHVHLGLYGSWRFAGDDSFVARHSIGAPRRRIGESETPGATSEHFEPPAPGPNVRLRLAIDSGVADLSGPSRCEVLTGAECRGILARLGPDPLRNEPGDRQRFIDLVRRRATPVGVLVLDQAVAAGPGNIYRAECLFRTGINPMRQGRRVSALRLGALWDDLVAAMNEGLDTGTIDTLEARYLPTDPADENDRRFAVYHRAGRPCPRCGRAVARTEIAGRTLFWCPACQR